MSDTTTLEKRVTLLAETKELARQQGVVETEIVELERERVLRTQELTDYRNTLAYDF
ncbi:MAG TPA: hypothetical protein VGC50_03950 [Gammaproteobacteria bacterium]